MPAVLINLILDPWFYAAAVPAVLFVGLSKGGLGGAMGQLGVPLLALVVSPVQGAAIMLPILIVMDIVALWSWRGYRDMRTLKIMLPGAMIGIFTGYLTAKMVTDDMVTLIVGLLGLWFVLRHIISARRKVVAARPHNAVLGAFWGTLAGFTSFVAHAGGPPYQIYTLPLKVDPKIYAGTSWHVKQGMSRVSPVRVFVTWKKLRGVWSTFVTLQRFALCGGGSLRAILGPRKR